jgi:hypothetical protein
VIPPPPPPCPPGQATGPPDFVGVGAQRAGTTWWHTLIAAHPGVHVPARAPKELHFFDTLTPPRRPSRDMAHRYHRYFPRPAGTITGEWTPRYLHDFWIPPLLAAAAPDAAILVLLRDPVERFRSGLTLALSRTGGAHRKLLTNEALSRGMYWTQLSRLYKWFPPERVLVLQYEQCASHPGRELARTYAFLGVDPDFRPSGLRQRVNGTPGQKVTLSAPQKDWLREEYQDDVSALGANVPGLDLSLWTSSNGS